MGFNSTHIYKTPYGSLPGASTIADIPHKRFLQEWASTETGMYIIRQVKAGLLDVNILTSNDMIYEAVRQAKNASFRKKSTTALDYGSLFHKWSENYDNKLNPVMSNDPILYKLQTAYLNWLEEYKPVLIQNEHTVWYWDYAMEIGFGGTLDRVWRMNWEGKEIIVVEDHKCSSQISESNWRQGEAYLRSYLQREQEKSHTETGGFYKPPDAIAILRLDKKAEKPTFEFKVKTNPQEREYYWQSYLGLLKYWWHNEELKKYRKELKKLEKGVAK